MSLTGTGLFTDSSASYVLTLYPAPEFINNYSTKNPIIATVGAVLIIVFTSAAFLLYDALVRKEVNDKKVVLEAKRNFMRFVSHEVRTPLASVVMGLKVMQDEVVTLFSCGWGEAPLDSSSVGIGPSSVGNGPPQNRCEHFKRSRSDYIIDLSQQIIGSAESAVTILSDLLHYDKIESGELPLELTIIDMWKLVEKSFKEFKLPFQAKHVEFNLDFGPLTDSDIEGQGSMGAHSAKRLPRDVLERRVIGDAIRLTQVLRNLVSNALKFTPEEGKTTTFLLMDRY